MCLLRQANRRWPGDVTWFVIVYIIKMLSNPSALSFASSQQSNLQTTKYTYKQPNQNHTICLTAPTSHLVCLSLVSLSILLTSSLEHDGLRKDGQPDQRVQQDQFAHGKVDPHEAGKQGGSASGGSGDSGSDNSGGSGGKGQFAGGKVDPVEAGRKGGQTSS